MAISKVFIAAVLICLLVHVVHADQVETVKESVSYAPIKIDCGAACKARCQLSSRPNLCYRACGTCCARCNCVPPGTSGNRDVCPCYATMTTHGGRLKCP